MLNEVLSRRSVLLLIAVATAIPCVTCASNPAQSKIFGLASTGLDAESITDAQVRAELLGKKLDVISVYEAFSWERPLPIPLLQSIADAGATPEITWEPWNPLADAVQPDFALAQIAGGRYDGYIAGWAKDAATHDKPLLLRFAHEMNGKWYPWSVRINDGTPTDYVAAFRRVHQIFADAGASKVQWVWSPNVIINGDTEAIAQSYPGDDVVDIVALDGYNFGDVQGHTWTSPVDLFGPTLDLVASIAPEKTVWINEVGCGDQGGDKIAWFTEMVNYLGSTDVCGLVLFDIDKPPTRDWRITSTPEMAAAARSALVPW